MTMCLSLGTVVKCSRKESSSLTLSRTQTASLQLSVSHWASAKRHLMVAPICTRTCARTVSTTWLLNQRPLEQSGERTPPRCSTSSTREALQALRREKSILIWLRAWQRASSAQSWLWITVWAITSKTSQGQSPSCEPSEMATRSSTNKKSIKMASSAYFSQSRRQAPVRNYRSSCITTASSTVACYRPIFSPCCQRWRPQK